MASCDGKRARLFIMLWGRCQVRKVGARHYGELDPRVAVPAGNSCLLTLLITIVCFSLSPLFMCAFLSVFLSHFLSLSLSFSLSL